MKHHPARDNARDASGTVTLRVIGNCHDDSLCTSAMTAAAES